MIKQTFWVVALAVHAFTVSAQTTSIDQSNIHEAVALWLTNESEAVATYGEIAQWDVSQVTNMSRLFSTELHVMLPAYDAEIPGIATFNEDLSAWDVSNVTTTYRMFFGASSFNQDLSGWDMSSATSLHMMFDSATDFNQPIGSWDVSNVTDMHRTFRLSGFNQDLSQWQTGQVRDFFGMFYASGFNGPIGNWDVSSAVTLSYMFRESDFNQPISDWNVSNVQSMTGTFQGSPFNQPIGNWDVSSVTKMEHTFQSSAFNQPIGDWDVSNVTRFKKMFYGCDDFNQDLSGWNVSSAGSMIQMFYHADLVDMNFGGWNISNVANMGGMLTATNMSSENYDATLVGWSTQTVQPDVLFASAGSWCSDEAGQARQVLVDQGWTISDGGRDVACLPAGCMDEAACNFDSLAEVDDASCTYPDACGECGGTGLDLTGTVMAPSGSWHFENGYPWGHFGIDYALYEQYSEFMVDGATLVLEMDGQTLTCQLDGGGFGDESTDYWYLIASDPTFTGGAFLYESFGQNLAVGATWTLPDVFCGCGQAVVDVCGECGGSGLDLSGSVGAWNEFHAANGYFGNFFGIETELANGYSALFNAGAGYAITIESGGTSQTFPIQYLGGPQGYDWRYVYVTVDGDPYGAISTYFPEGIQPGDTWYITDAFCDCEQTTAAYGYDCDGNCAADSDEDGVCDPFDACSDTAACNYNAASNAACDYVSCLGCTNTAACNYDAAASTTLMGSVLAISPYATANGYSGNFFGANMALIMEFDDDLAPGMALTVDGQSHVLDAIDYPNNVNQGLAILYVATAATADGNPWTIGGSLDATVWAGDQWSIELGDALCTYPDACGNCGGAGVDADGDGICDALDNCIDTTACNYDDPANGACDFSGAQWYLPDTPSLSAGPALFTCNAPTGYSVAESQDCVDWLAEVDPWCVNNHWDQYCVAEYQLCVDGCTFIQLYPDPIVCLDVFGCMDDAACNFDDTANIDDGFCTYPGCTNADACNYDASAGCDDGSCEFAAPLIYSDFEHTAGGNGNGNGNAGGNGNGNSGGSNGYTNGYGSSTVFWSIWNDGGSDCRLSGADAAFATSGTRCVRLRDNSSTSHTTTDNLEFSAFDRLTVTFNFEAASMEAGEAFHLEYSTDGGSSFTTAATYVRGEDFENGVSYTGWNEDISAEFTDATRLRFRCDASDNNDYIYLDDIYINGCEGAPDIRSFEATEMTASAATWGRAYPNPATQVVTVEWLEDSEAMPVEVVLMDMAGRVVLAHSVNAEGANACQLNIAHCNAGIYILVVNKHDQRWTQPLLIE